MPECARGESTVAAATATYPANPEDAWKPDVQHPCRFLVDAYAAFLAAVSVAMALNARERDGLGQVIRSAAVRRDVRGCAGYRAQRIHNATGDDGMAAAHADDGCVTRRFGGARTARLVRVSRGEQERPGFLRRHRQRVGSPPRRQRHRGRKFAKRPKRFFRTKTAAEWEAVCEEAHGTEERDLPDERGVVGERACARPRRS